MSLGMASALCPPVRAQDQAAVDPFALSPEQLFDAMVVSVSRMPENLRDAPAAVYVLTSEDIRRSGATSIPEALRLVPGVQVMRVNASSWAISVRGFSGALTNKLLVLIDGRTVYDPLFSGVYWDVQDVPLEDIERIEVVRGPGATEWGANAVNGVINIITKSATDTHGLSVTALGGNVDRANVSVDYGDKAGANADWRVYTKYTNVAPSDTPAGRDAYDAWTTWRGGFRFDAKPDPAGDAFTIQGDTYKSDSGDLRSVPQLTKPFATVQQESIVATGSNILARWNRDVSADSHFTAQAYLDTTDRDQLTLKDSRTTYDIDTQYGFPLLGWNGITIGAGYRTTDDTVTPTTVITTKRREHAEELLSSFIQDKIALDQNHWYLTLGSKFEENHFTGFEVQPSARLQWNGESDTVWTSVSRAVRTPSELERDFTVVTGVIPPSKPIPLPVAVDLVPSPKFESEELVAYELGYRRQWTPSLLTDLTAFYNDYQKLSTLSLLAPTIVFAPPPAYVLLPIGSTNETKAHTYGFEAVVNWRAADTLNFSTSYSYLQMILDGPPSTVAIASEAAATQSPHNQFNVRAQWDIDKNLAFDTTVYYVDKVPAYSVDAHTRLDTSLGWRLDDQTEIDLVGQNLLDGKHREFNALTDVNATEIARSFYLKLVWRP